MVFYYATLLMLHGLNPYNVPPTVPWMYSNPVTYPQWYAYPPFGLLVLSSLSALPYLLGALNIMTFRIILKMILIASVFWTAKRLEALRKGSGKLFLLNPLVWFVVAVHGMIDALAVALMVEGLYRLLFKRKLWWLFYGFSLATKQTTWITIFPIMVYAARKKGLCEALAPLLVLLALSAPFYSNGFVQYVLSFHEDRPPASLGYTGIPLIMVAGDSATFHIANVVAPCFGKPIPKVGWGSYVLSALFALGILYSGLRALRRDELFKPLAIASLSFILFSKVVSPQNLLVPLAIFLIIGVSNKVLTFFGTLAMIVDAIFGTVYGVLGYLAEDVLNSLGSSIVVLYRMTLPILRIENYIGLVSLILYHVAVVAIVYFLFVKKVKRKWVFAILYVIYIIMVLNSVSYSNGGNMYGVRNVVLGKKGAAIWIWLNPYNGLRAGDYAFLNNTPNYWEYTYPLAVEMVKWLKSHGYKYVALVFSIDRMNLYAYMPWLFALAKYNMPYVWMIVIPHDLRDYLHGYASYDPDLYKLSEVANFAYKMTPVYLNRKISEIESKLSNIISAAPINVTVNEFASKCPLPYVSEDGKAVIIVKGLTRMVKNNDYILIPEPKNLVEINNYYKGTYLPGTPITQREKGIVIMFRGQRSPR